MTDQPACAHTRLVVIESGAVTCQDCGTGWIPIEAMDAIIEKQVGVAASFTSSLLWKLHENVVDRYGEAMAEALVPEGTRDKSEESSLLDFDQDGRPSTCSAHEFVSGQCQVCGASQFLGGG